MCVHTDCLHNHMNSLRTNFASVAILDLLTLKWLFWKHFCHCTQLASDWSPTKYNCANPFCPATADGFTTISLKLWRWLCLPGITLVELSAVLTDEIRSTSPSDVGTEKSFPEGKFRQQDDLASRPTSWWGFMALLTERRHVQGNLSTSPFWRWLWSFLRTSESKFSTTGITKISLQQ